MGLAFAGLTLVVVIVCLRPRLVVIGRDLVVQGRAGNDAKRSVDAIKRSSVPPIAGQDGRQRGSMDSSTACQGNEMLFTRADLCLRGLALG